MDFVIGILSVIGETTGGILCSSDALLGAMVVALIVYAIVYTPRSQTSSRRSTQNNRGRKPDQNKGDIPDPGKFW